MMVEGGLEKIFLKSLQVMREVYVIFVTKFIVLGKNLTIYEVRKNNFPPAWRNFKNIFPKPLFTITFRQKIVIQFCRRQQNSIRKKNGFCFCLG
jgi:hypothetical protein